LVAPQQSQSPLQFDETKVGKIMRKIINKLTKNGQRFLGFNKVESRK